MTEIDGGDRCENEEPCPSWCVAEHEHQGDIDQRWHHSVVSELPLVELASGNSSALEGEVALTFDVALEQPWGLPRTYVLLGVGAERARTFCITLESAERLVAAILDAVQLARARDSRGV